MKKYPIVSLGEVCEFTYGDGLKETDRKGGNIPVYGSNGIVGWHDKAITKGETIIIGRKGSIGEIHLSKVPCWAIDTTYYVDKTKVPCDFTWLYYTLKALDLTRLNKSAAVPGLNREDAYEQKLPLPPLDEQKRIASLLARADRLRQLRRAARRLADSLLQSVFVEMFGDLETNEMGWDFYELGELDLYISDGNYSSKYPRADEFVSKGIPFIRANNLKNHTVVWDDMRYITPEKHEYLQKGHIRPDDLLITTRGNIGLAGIVPSDFDDANINAQLVLIRCKGTKLNPRFLLWALENPKIKKQFDYLQTGTALQQLPVGNLIQLEIPLPPLPLQEEFARVAARVEALRARQAEAERQAEALFQSLLAASFTPSVLRTPPPNPKDLGEAGWG